MSALTSHNNKRKSQNSISPSISYFLCIAAIVFCRLTKHCKSWADILHFKTTRGTCHGFVDGPHLRLRHILFYQLMDSINSGASLSDSHTALASAHVLACWSACLWPLPHYPKLNLCIVKLYTTLMAMTVSPLTVRDCGVSYFQPQLYTKAMSSQ